MNKVASSALGLVSLFLQAPTAFGALQNYIPNGSFENGSSVNPGTRFKANKADSPATEDWVGGFITEGNGTMFCTPQMADGTYGLAFHVNLPEATVSFTLPQTGYYELSYRMTCRNITPYTFDQALHVYFDDDSVPVSTRYPESPLAWAAVTNTPLHLSAGSHRLRLVGWTMQEAIASQNPSVVLDDVRLVRFPGRPRDVLPNGGFEELVGNGVNDFKVNGRDGVQLRGWSGGIVTRGGDKQFCKANVFDGSFAVALHNEFPAISNRFEVVKGGIYELSFYTVSRYVNGLQPCTQTLSVYFDDETEPLCQVLPTSTTTWNFWTFSRRFKSGGHVIRFVGTNPILPGKSTPNDSSTVIDAVRIRLLQGDQGLALILR